MYIQNINILHFFSTQISHITKKPQNIVKQRQKRVHLHVASVNNFMLRLKPFRYTDTTMHLDEGSIFAFESQLRERHALIYAADDDEDDDDYDDAVDRSGVCFLMELQRQIASIQCTAVLQLDGIRDLKPLFEDVSYRFTLVNTYLNLTHVRSALATQLKERTKELLMESIKRICYDLINMAKFHLERDADRFWRPGVGHEYLCDIVQPCAHEPRLDPVFTYLIRSSKKNAPREVSMTSTP